MKERGILFSAPMVRALLAGTKTQTRRVLKEQPQRGGWPWPPMTDTDRAAVLVHCPYGAPGDRLWVREAFRFPSSLDKLSPTAIGDKALDAGYNAPWCPTLYEADGARTSTWSAHTPPTDTVPGRLRAGMHMPRWASRIALEVVSVRVERLHHISDADSIAEGAAGHPDGPWHAYRSLWSLISGAGSWDANPWVWAVEFRRLP